VGDVTRDGEKVGLLSCLHVARARDDTVTLPQKCLDQGPADTARASRDDGGSCVDGHGFQLSFLRARRASRCAWSWAAALAARQQLCCGAILPSRRGRGLMFSDLAAHRWTTKWPHAEASGTQRPVRTKNSVGRTPTSASKSRMRWA